ncbi:hypothetical protein [Calothrix sp. NIES-2098]|uniref:hypothetical protein n=1 Tax=Calothrix sp. NIES-2098 TaxID=1954171 RepID=UPI000B619C9A|nr:hypothetical protein NIES2098_13160 [Calothrix sp. NIES-2098]
MFDAFLAVYLWVILFSIFCWLVTPETVIIEKGKRRASEIIVETKTLPHHDTLKTLNVRQARKVAGKLGIPQKINAKDAPKKWLIQQINAKLETHQQEVRDALYDVGNVA